MTANVGIRHKSLGTPRVEINVSVYLIGWMIRLYAGTAYFDRPKVHVWKMWGDRGVTLRRSNKMPGPDGCRVVGLQWGRRDLRRLEWKA